MAIHFARAWEDDRLDLELLAVGPGASALVVAGAGDLALALAADGVSVTAVDSNPDQLRLGRLKVAAAQALDHERAHAWFEGRGGPEARSEYRRLRPALEPDDAAWWDRRLELLADGLCQGTGVGRALGWLGRLARLVVPGLARTVETVREPAEQLEWWRRRVEPRVFAPPTHWLVAHTPILGPLAPNRHERRRIRDGHWSRGLARRVDGIVAAHLVRELPWWRPFASNRPVDAGYGAAWLDRGRVAALAAGPQVGWQLGDLTAALEAARDGSLDAISLSNVPDWLEPGAEARLALAAARAVRPDGVGRVLVRHVVRPALPDPFVAAGLVRDPASDVLPARDRTALYEAVDLYRAA
jgi:S-adenosylmethionine:diacylglycerol 3-amino-3-carboxypropyl transferase